MNEEALREMAQERGGGGGGDMAAMMAAQASQQLTTMVVGAIVLWAAVVYFYLFWDRRSADSANKDDGQVGLKLVIFSFLLFTLVLAVTGLDQFLSFLLAGAKNKGDLKSGLAHVLAGGALFAATFFLLLPRTNSKDYPQTERYAVGSVALAGGLTALMAFAGLLNSLFNGANWKLVTSGHFANLIVYGALGALALIRFGSMSGWTAPQRMMPPGFPPAGGGQGGYPPQQGYPPQGGGYPPQGGGYPPQGGGYPPAGGGYPPAGGGYPPQGGGLPPPGGYQPR